MSRKIGVFASLVAALTSALLLVGVLSASAAPKFQLRQTVIEGPVYVAPGVPVEYNAIAVNLSAKLAHVRQVVVVEPSGFSYVGGSTEGGISGDPAINGNLLTWTASNPAGGPISISSQGALQFQFQADAAAGPAPNTWFFARVTITLTNGQVFNSSLEAPVNVS
jgi:hypothetical protein